MTKAGAARSFEKPVDYIGVKTLGNAAAYAAYAGKHIHDIRIPGCPAARTRAAFSSASARKASPSTWARSSTW